MLLSVRFLRFFRKENALPATLASSFTMKRAHLLSTCTKIAAAGAIFLSASAAHALQPLEAFLAGAKSQNFDAREQAATVAQRGWERSAALGRLLPSFTARGVYTHNQYETAVQLPGTNTSVVITPQNQLDAFFQVDIPVLDLENYHRYAGSQHREHATEAQTQLVGANVETAVARAYYTLIGTSALTEAAEKSLASAEDNLSFVTTRADLGAATNLDAERARANVERVRQDLTDAKLGRDLAARSLQTLTGVTPAAVEHFPEASLTPEASLASWVNGGETPGDRVQSELTKAAASDRKAAQAALLPKLSASARQHVTNATGFSGRSSSYQVQAVLSWRFDWGTYASSRARGSAEEAQQVRQDRTKRTTQDSIYDAYKRIESGIVKCQAARAQAAAAQKAAELAEERYRGGAATQLDVTQAQRDAFAAEVARVQADADLAFSRVQLRAISGKPVDFQRRPSAASPVQR